MKNILIMNLIILTMLTLACSKNNVNMPVEDKVNVAVSIVPQATFVEKVGGDLVDIVTIIPPGNSPANYEVRPNQMKKLSKSSLYFAIGVPTEAVNILQEIKNYNKEIKIVDLSKTVSVIYPDRHFTDEESHSHEDGIEHEDDRDQHIWLSPKRVTVMVEEIAKELSILDPMNKDIYNKNANAYIDELNKLDKHLKETISKMEKKAFLIYHPSFGYFAEDYGLKMISVENQGKEATAKELKEIVDIAKAKEIKVVFYQSEIHNKQSEVLAEEIGGESIELRPLAENYIENMYNISIIFEETLDKYK